MKKIVLLALSLVSLSIFTGCEHEHWHHGDGYRGGPGPGYDQGWGHHDMDDRRWR